MLYAAREKSSKIEEIQADGKALLLLSERGKLRLMPISQGCIRVTYTERDTFSQEEKQGVIRHPAFASWQYETTQTEVKVITDACVAVVDRTTGSITFTDRSGKRLLKEADRESKTLEDFQTYRLYEEGGIRTEKIKTADGVKEVVSEAMRIPDKRMYHTRLSLEWQENEALYGLGQQEEGFGNLRGKTVYVHQANRKIAIPVLVSSLGYGLLLNTDSPFVFHDDEYGSCLYGECDDELDYFFLYGGDMDGVVREYRKLTGKAAMLPKWAFGYIQSQERYETAEEILSLAKEYRRRGIGVDALVLDWCSWEDGMWGQKSFDGKRFPDPAAMTEKLHEMDIRFMISVWPNMDPNCENYKEMKEKGQILPGSSIYNALSEEGRKLYWKQACDGIFQYGVDSWWCDSSEPITPEWSHKYRPDAAGMYAEYCKAAADLLPPGKGNAYAFYHAKSLYEGQRNCSLFPQKRVCNLTRSAWTGQQRYGTILWSGDVDASFDTLRKQVAAGLHFCASGLPYWTTDIGAFFVKNSNFWYWKGDFDQTTADAGYRELFTRWYQWGAFLPIFRGHGTDCRRELWMFGEENGTPGDCGDMFYQAILAANRRRYALMPYIYSQAGKVWLNDASMMRHLAFEFAGDSTVLDIFDQYMFGESLMVCPVTTPMYYGAGSEKLEGIPKTRKVYLPKGCGWYDFDTKAYYEGGQWIEAEAGIDRIPMYVKAGSILPMTAVSDRVQVREEILYHVYGGRDCDYTLYLDDGDGYAYEQGEYECLHLHWSEKEGTLTDENGKKYPVKRY